MRYKVQIHKGRDDRSPADDATVVGLPEDEYLYQLTSSDGRPRGDEIIQFGHHKFVIVWDDKLQRQVSVPGNTFYGGIGEGRSFDNWKDAIGASLYDLYQLNDQLKEGDEFECTYLGETALFRCVSAHVVLVE